MVSLRLFAIILTTLVCRELAESTPWLVWRSSLLAMLGMTLGCGILFRAYALAALKAGPSLPLGAVLHQDVLRRLQRKRELVEVLWCLLLPATLLATGWGDWLSALEQAGIAHAFTLLGYFVPTLFFLALIEITAAQVDAILLESDEAPEDERSDGIGWQADSVVCPLPVPKMEAGSTGGGRNWPSQLLVRLRLGEMTGLLTCIAPVLMISSFGDVLVVASQYVAPQGLDRTVATAVGTLMAFAVLVVAFPSALSHLSRARKIEGSLLAERIATFTHKLQLRGIQPLLITSQGRWAGAAIVGWLPLFRKLWLGDALIAQLSDRELDMVVLHELAHVKRSHFLWRTLPVAVSAIVAVLAWQAVSGLPAPANWTVALQLLVCSLAGASLVFLLGMAAKYCELDADRVACQLAGVVCEWAGESLDAPETQMRGALIKLMDAPGSDAATWLHPSLRQRVENLMSTRIRQD